MQPGMLAHAGPAGVQWTEYPYQQPPQQPGQPLPQPYTNSLPPQPSQPLSLDPAGGPPFNSYATGQGWNGQQYAQQQQQGAYYPSQQQGGTGQGPGGVVGPLGGGGGVPLNHQQQQQMAMLGGQQQRMNGYAQQNGMIGYDGGGMGGLPPPPPQQQQYAPPAYPPRSQPPPSSNAPPPYPPQPSYGMNYVHSTNPTSSSPAPPPMVAMSATAQRFQSTPSSSPAPPSQQLGHPPHPPPPPQQQSQPPPPPPDPSSSAAAAAAAAQRAQQQQQGHPPPTAASLQAHLSRVEEVKAMQQNIRQLELILQRGTYQDGAPRAGQPMAPEHRAAMERQLQELKTAELGVINECETFIRAHGGSGNVHHYVERYHAAHAQQAHLQRQQQSQQQAYSQQLAAAAAQQQQQQTQAGMYGALPQPPRPASAASFQQQQMGGGGGEMGLPQQVHQRVASYQGQDFSPRPAHHLPPQQQQQQKPPLPPGQQPGMPPPHPQYPPQPGMPRQLPPQPGVHPQVQHQLHRQASSNSLGGVPAPHPPLPPGMTLPQQSSLPPHPHSMPPHQLPPHPQQQQQQRPPPPSSAQPQPPSGNAPNPPPGHPLSQPAPPSSIPVHAHNPLQPPSSSATTMSFSPDIPSGLRAQMAAAAREQAQRALVANRAKMTQQAVRPAVNGEMPVLTTAGFRTKDEWEKMQKEQEAREAARSAAAAAAAAAAKGRAAGNAVATVVGEAGKTHPTVMLAEQAANGGGAVPTLGELVAKVQPQQFWEQLKVVLSKRGVSIAPQGYFVEQRAVNLYELWKLVVGQHGGVLKADQSSAWPAIAAQLNLPSAPSSPIPALLKELYHRTLVAYEEQWSGSIVKQREKEQAMQGAKRMLEARGNGGGGANANAKGNAAPGGGPQQPFSNGHALQQQQFQLGIGPSAQQPQNYVPTSGSPGSFTLPTPAPLANSASSPSLPFTLPSGTAFNLPAASPSTHAYTPLPSKNGLTAGASPSQSSMFATSMMPFPPTPMSDPTYASLPLAPTPTSGGGYPPLQHTMASAQLHRTQRPPPPPPPAEEEPSIEELLAAAAELKAERLAEKAQKAAGQVTSPLGAATVTASTPQTSSTPREQVASPTALAAAAAGQVAPFSLSGAPPSVTLSRANSHSAAAAAVSTPTAASSPGQLAGGTPGSETLSRGASGSRKRDRQMSRETDGGGSGVNGSTAAGGGGGGEGQNADEDEEDEGRKREGSNPFQHSPLSSRAVGAGAGGRISPALAMTPAASSVSSAPPTDGQPTPDLVASKALRPDTGTTTATGGGSPSPHAFSDAFASKAAAAANGQQAVSTPASTAPTPSSLHTPSAQLAAGLGGGLTISTPPVPTYAASSSAVSVPISDPFAALNDLNTSPSLGGLGGWDVDAAAVGTATHSSLNLDFGPSGVGDLSVGGGLNGLGGGDGLDFSAFDFGADAAGDAGHFAIPDGFDFLDTATSSASTNNGGGASSAASGAAGALPHGLQEAGRKPSDDWTGGLLDFEFASDGFN